MQQCGLEAPKRLQGLLGLARNCGWFWPFEGVVILTERPVFLHRDERNRLHREDGPALLYTDGFALWKWHGVTVPRDVIESPSQITVDRIDGEANAEVRRVMIDRYGPSRYVIDSGSIVVHEIAEDHELTGLRTARLLRKDVQDDEPILYVDVLNSTSEGLWQDVGGERVFVPELRDGEPYKKRYMLRVDPNAYNGEASRNAHAAAASTWRNADGSLTYQRWQDYRPVAES